MITTNIYIIIILVIIVIIMILFLTITSKDTYKNMTRYKIPIDAVITYVDNSDLYWQKEFNKYNSNYNEDDSIEGKNSYRFKSHDEILYCIKSINKYAPFFRKIYIVVAYKSQIKNLPESKIPITVIYHHEFYKNKKHLPTFNSTSIEANIHNIPGLSEFFVYFNDDCLFGNTITEKDFILKEKDGTIKLAIQLEKLVVSHRGEPYNTEIGFYSSWKNTNKMLDELFPKTKHEYRKIVKHIPQIQRKSTHIKLNKIFNKQFNKTSESKFRGINIHNTSAGLAEYYELYTGNAIMVRDANSYRQAYVNNNLTRNERYYNKIKQVRPKYINIQSTISETNNIADFQMKEFLKEYYS